MNSLQRVYGCQLSQLLKVRYIRLDAPGSSNEYGVEDFWAKKGRVEYSGGVICMEIIDQSRGSSRATLRQNRQAAVTVFRS